MGTTCVKMAHKFIIQEFCDAAFLTVHSDCEFISRNTRINKIMFEFSLDNFYSIQSIQWQNQSHQINTS